MDDTAMKRDDLKEAVLRLLSSPSYMPMRKRGLARQLSIDDEDYLAFKELLSEMASDGTIDELKKGKWGLPLGGKSKSSRAPAPHSANNSDPKDHSEKSSEAPSKPVDKALPKNVRLGRIDVKRGGMAYLLSDPPGNDLYIAQEDVGGALNGDLVAVDIKRDFDRGSKRNGKFFRGGGSSRPSGRVVKIVERANPVIVGTYFSHRQTTSLPAPVHRDREKNKLQGIVVGHVVPDTRGVFSELDVLFENRGEAKDQDKVAIELVEVSDSKTFGQRPTARVTKIYGKAGEADADIAAILENFHVKLEFSEEALAEAEAIPDEIPEDELAQRVFYEHPVTFTIDPEDAKDHDDAVALRVEPDGGYTLLVHIADVSYYVKEDSPIDREARERATSVYLPGKVYPMLPPKLSNNMCSLKEGKLRLTKTITMTYGKNMTVIKRKVERSAIRSAAFLTYDQVRDALEGNKPELVRTPEIFKALTEMREFSAKLRKKRFDSGSLNLDLPETKLLLDEKNEVKGWTLREHHWAHELIEEMMLAANRAVAEHLLDNEIPGLFRVHEEPNPEALEKFAEFVREFGISLRPPYDRLKLKYAIDRASTMEAGNTIHLALLTSLKQAKYAVDCLPHFALNFSKYLHFTSPIRRYPDLLVHRALDERFKPGESALPEKPQRREGGDKARTHFKRVDLLRSLADHCSRREREAAGAEGEVIKFRQMQFLRRNMRESHPGVITRVRDFGLTIKLQDCFVEGLVRKEDMQDDWYEFVEERHLLQGRKRGRCFQLGDKVEVRVVDIDLARKHVNLEIV
jgi:ribonuclease R